MVINAKDPTLTSMTMTAVRCVDDCPLPPAPELPTGKGGGGGPCKLWSQLEDWDGRVALPQDGDDIIIPITWCIRYDIPVSEAPRLNSLEVNGQLIFEPGADRLLKTFNFFVRAGSVEIGSEETPFDSIATIELQGDNTEQYFTFNSAIESGNKNLVVTGNVAFYGLPRDYRSRLQATVNKGDTSITVESGLDWQVGEKIVIAPSNMRTMDTDICEIQSISGNTITCTSALEGYHFGDSSSTETDYGVDMRSEVALLTRNIRIVPSADVSNTLPNSEVWGCRVLVADFIDADENGSFPRSGSLAFDNVEVEGCGQKNSFKSAIKFTNAQGGGSVIKNSAIHQGKAPGIIMMNS